MGPTVGLAIRESKLRSTLGRYFRSRGVSIAAADRPQQLPNLAGRGAPDVLIIEPSAISQDLPARLRQWAAEDSARRLLCLVGQTEAIPSSLAEIEGVARLHRPVRRAELESLLPQGLALRRREIVPKSPPTGRKLSLRTKITLPYVMLAVVLGAAAILVTTQVILDTVEERFTNQLIEAGRLGNEWMVLEEDRLLEALRAIARTEGVAASLEAGDADSLRQLALPVAVNSSLDAVEFVNGSGANLLSLRHRQGASPEVYDTGSGYPLRELGFVAASLAAVEDERGDKHSGVVSDGSGSWFFVSGPIYSEEGQVVGAVLVGEPLDRLATEMRSATLGQVSLYSLGGAHWASTFLQPMDLGDSDLSQLDWSGENSFTRNVTVANIEYREILGPWSARGDNLLGTLGIALPQSFLVRASRWTRVQVGGIVLLGLTLILTVGIYISRRITEPILHLVRASDLVARGNLSLKLRPQGNDEIAVLTNSFNEMIQSLRKGRLELLDAYDSTLEGWSRALELRDVDTEGHTRRVVAMATSLARAMGINGKDLIDLRRGAMLHDIGKMGIPDEILHKPSALSDDEWAIMRLHPIYGFNMLRDIKYLNGATDIPLHHHERWDGEGYPHGLEAEAIPLQSRVFAVADVVDALLSDRPYRPAWAVNQVVDHVRDNRGKHFDPAVVDAFLRLVQEGELELRQALDPARVREPAT